MMMGDGETQRKQSYRGEASDSSGGAHCVLSAEAWDLKHPSPCPQLLPREACPAQMEFCARAALSRRK